MGKIKIKLTAEEVVRAKFLLSLTKIEGYLKEAQGDELISGEYTAYAVKKRIQCIKDALLKDLNELAKQIDVCE